MSKEGGGPPPYSGSGDDRALVCLDSLRTNSGELGSRFLYLLGEIWWIELLTIGFPFCALCSSG
ncbi:hypothetical protein BT69DRAFT_1284561 [Atractiella rhizophila]|nr:hypothetical protein BT69DRAFT_1284561 [Atractiella rhizophila]